MKSSDSPEAKIPVPDAADTGQPVPAHFASSHVEDESVTTTTRPLEIRESDLPPTFQAADRWAIAFQNHHLRFVKAHVLLGVVGASAAQMAFSLSGATGFVWALALCVLAQLVTRVLVQRRPRWERIWCRSRAVAEQIRSLSWTYMMGVTPVVETGGKADGMPAAKAKVEAAIRLIREEWVQAVNAETRLPATGSEVNDRMDEVRGRPHANRVRLYLNDRVNDQINWYRNKAGFNRERRLIFLAIAVLCELGAAGISVALLVHLAKPSPGDAGLQTALKYLLTFVWPCLAGATAASGWAGFRRYGELAITYQRSAEQLAAIRVDIERLTEDSEPNRQAFAGRVRECEELLTRENAIWFSRRSV